LWEECCAKADEIGPEGVKELENQLTLFQGYCNRMNGADGNNHLGTGKKINDYTTKKDYSIDSWSIWRIGRKNI
jgi:hypothetical protein